jgi:signal transduction histidine kinase
MIKEDRKETNDDIVGYVRVSVNDNGSDIDPEIMSNLF